MAGSATVASTRLSGYPDAVKAVVAAGSETLQSGVCGRVAWMRSGAELWYWRHQDGPGATVRAVRLKDTKSKVFVHIGAAVVVLSASGLLSVWRDAGVLAAPTEEQVLQPSTEGAPLRICAFTALPTPSAGQSGADLVAAASTTSGGLLLLKIQEGAPTAVQALPTASAGTAAKSGVLSMVSSVVKAAYAEAFDPLVRIKGRSPSEQTAVSLHLTQLDAGGRFRLLACSPDRLDAWVLSAGWHTDSRLLWSFVLHHGLREAAPGLREVTGLDFAVCGPTGVLLARVADGPDGGASHRVFTLGLQEAGCPVVRSARGLPPLPESALPHAAWAVAAAQEGHVLCKSPAGALLYCGESGSWEVEGEGGVLSVHRPAHSEAWVVLTRFRGVAEMGLEGAAPGRGAAASGAGTREPPLTQPRVQEVLEAAVEAYLRGIVLQEAGSRLAAGHVFSHSESSSPLIHFALSVADELPKHWGGGAATGASIQQHLEEKAARLGGLLGFLKQSRGLEALRAQPRVVWQLLEAGHRVAAAAELRRVHNALLTGTEEGQLAQAAGLEALIVRSVAEMQAGEGVPEADRAGSDAEAATVAFYSRPSCCLSHLQFAAGDAAAGEVDYPPGAHLDLHNLAHILHSLLGATERAHADAYAQLCDAAPGAFLVEGVLSAHEAPARRALQQAALTCRAGLAGAERGQQPARLMMQVTSDLLACFTAALKGTRGGAARRDLLGLYREWRRLCLGALADDVFRSGGAAADARGEDWWCGQVREIEALAAAHHGHDILYRIWVEVGDEYAPTLFHHMASMSLEEGAEPQETCANAVFQSLFDAGRMGTLLSLPASLHPALLTFLAAHPTLQCVHLLGAGGFQMAAQVASGLASGGGDAPQVEGSTPDLASTAPPGTDTSGGAQPSPGPTHSSAQPEQPSGALGTLSDPRHTAALAKLAALAAGESVAAQDAALLRERLRAAIPGAEALDRGAPLPALFQAALGLPLPDRVPACLQGMRAVLAHPSCLAEYHALFLEAFTAMVTGHDYGALATHRAGLSDAAYLQELRRTPVYEAMSLCCGTYAMGSGPYVCEPAEAAALEEHVVAAARAEGGDRVATVVEDALNLGCRDAGYEREAPAPVATQGYAVMAS